MARIRTIYATDALYVGPTPSTGHHFTQTGDSLPDTAYSGNNQVVQLHRIQSVNYSFNFNRTPIYQFGGLATKDHAMLAPPGVSLGFTYLLGNFWNESGMGFVTAPHTSAISGFLNKTRDDKNYFLKTSPEGVDAQGDTRSNSDVTVMGVGNGFITSYSLNAAVGALPTVSVGVEGMNMTFQQTTSGIIPAVNPNDGSTMNGITYNLPVAAADAGTGNLAVSVLRPGDIFFTIYQRPGQDEGNLGPATETYSTVGANLSTIPIQRVDLGFNIGREVIPKLGSKYGVSREVTFPVPITVTVEGLAADFNSGNIFNMVNCDKEYDLTLDLYRPSGCGNVGRYVMCKYIVKNAVLDGQNFSENIGSNKTVSLTFTSSVGGPFQSGIGLFMSGITTPAGSVI